MILSHQRGFEGRKGKIMVNFYSGTATIDENFYLRKADDAFYRFFGNDIYASVCEVIHNDELVRFQTAIQAIKEQDMSRNFVSLRMRRANGKYRWMNMEIIAEPFDIDGLAMFSIKVIDLAETENCISELKREGLEHELYFNMLNSILICYDTEEDYLEIFQNIAGRKNYFFSGRLQEWKDSIFEKVEAVFQNTFEQLISDIASGKKQFEYEIIINGFIRSVGKDVCIFKCQTVRSSARSYKVLGCIILEGKGRNQSALFGNNNNKDAGMDVLNKRAIIEYAKFVLKNERNKGYFVVLDLDNFKQVNDNYGHIEGDKVLATIAEIIKEAVGNFGVVGRIGGDEIFIVVDRISDHAEFRNLLRTIRTNIEWEFKGGEKDINVTCSMGAVAYPEQGREYDVLFALADKMMYRAKEKGKNRYIIYTPEIHDEKLQKKKSSNKEEWVRELRNDRLGIIRRLIEEYLIKKSITNETMCNEIGYGFGLDEIVISYNNGLVAFYWTPDGIGSDNSKCVPVNKDFMESFDKNQLLILNGLHNLEGKNVEIRKYLEDKQVQSAVFYKFKNSEKQVDYVAFFRKNNRQKWSDYEILTMTVIGTVFERAMGDR